MTVAPELMRHVLLPYKWKEIIYQKGCSFNMKSVLEHGRPLSSETISSEQQLETRSRRRLLGKIILFWQTKSHAIIVHHPVPPDCFVKVIAKNGKQTLFERLSTPRPAPEVILRSSWQVQQQQQPQQPATRLRRLGADRAEEKSQDRRTEITTSIFNKIDLRVDGIPQEAILKEEIQMRNIITETVQKLQIGSQMQSIRDDLNKEDMIFRKESSEDIYKMVNVELIELRQSTATVRCPACSKHILEGMLQCLCGNWLRPDEHTVNQVKLRFGETCQNRFYRVLDKQIRRDADTDSFLGKQAHWKARDAKKGAWKHCKHESLLEIWQKDELYRTGQAEEHVWTIEWVKYLDFLTTVDISYTVPNFQRNLQENMARLRSNDSHLKAGQFIIGKIGDKP